MPKLKIVSLIFFVAALPLLTAGCVTVKTGDSGGNDGGIYKSANKGDTWAQKTLIPTISGQPRSFAGTNAFSLAIDPNDSRALYYGSVDNGLIYTYDGGENWQVAAGLGKQTIRAVAVDPHSKCIIYAAIGNKLFRSTDCNRTWSQIYYDNDTSATVDAVAIDHYNSDNLYIAISRGDIVKSANRGEGWQAAARLSDKIKKIAIDPNDSRRVYALTAKKGLFRSDNSGRDWQEVESLIETVKELKLGSDYRDFELIDDQDGLIYLATFYGLLRSADGGGSWERIELITPEKKTAINAIAVNGANTDEIYYVTNTTFYSSIDGGQSWTTIKMPSTRAGWHLIIDPDDTDTIYMGVQTVKK